jgi:hypothetical protein
MYSIFDSKRHFLDVNEVLIENQPSLKNPTMKSVQMVLYTFFIMKIHEYGWDFEVLL